MTAIKEFRALSPTARWLLLASGVSNFGSGLVLPLLVLYLAKGHGFDIVTATTALACTSAAALVGGLVAGWASDRLGRVPTVLCATATAALGTCLYAAVDTPWHALLAATVFGLGIGANGAWQALLAESVAPDQRPVAFSFNFGITNAALGVGGLVAGSVVVVDDLWSFRALYLVNALSFVIAGCLMAVVARRGATGVNPKRDLRRRDEPRGSYMRLLRNRRLTAVLVISLLLFVVGYSQLESGIPAVLVAEVDISAADLSKVFLADTVVAVVAQVSLLGVVKRTSHRASLTIAALTWSVFWVLVLVAVLVDGAVVRLILLCTGAAIASVGAAFYAASVPTLVHAAAADDERGRANALYGMSVSIGYTIGPALVGPLAGQGLLHVVVGVALVVTIGVAILARSSTLAGADGAAALNAGGRAA